MQHLTLWQSGIFEYKGEWNIITLNHVSYCALVVYMLLDLWNLTKSIWCFHEINAFEYPHNKKPLRTRTFLRPAPSLPKPIPFFEWHVLSSREILLYSPVDNFNLHRIKSVDLPSPSVHDRQDRNAVFSESIHIYNRCKKMNLHTFCIQWIKKQILW